MYKAVHDEKAQGKATHDDGEESSTAAKRKNARSEARNEKMVEVRRRTKRMRTKNKGVV